MYDIFFKQAIIEDYSFRLKVKKIYLYGALSLQTGTVVILKPSVGVCIM